MRITIAMSRKSVLAVGWVASLIAACVFGWGIARRPARVTPHVAANPTPVVRELSPPPVPVAPPLAPPPELPVVDPEPVVTPPKPTPEAAPKKKSSPPAEPPPVEPPVVEPPPVAIAERRDPAPPPRESVRERARQADRLAGSGQTEAARATAEALFTELPSTTVLAAALVEAGASEVEAKLDTVRLLQLAGREGMSRTLARELKRSYAGTAMVVESIDRWGLLTPRIVDVESSVEGGRELVVTGTLENPDIGDVRQVRIVVEALDGAGSVLAKAEARVRPKVLSPGSTGDFSARFKKLDPTTVLRTRTVLVGWESEILNEG